MVAQQIQICGCGFESHRKVFGLANVVSSDLEVISLSKVQLLIWEQHLILVLLAELYVRQCC